jgi:hypothetical protein
VESLSEEVTDAKDFRLGRKRVLAMADFNELLIQAYRLLDTARMLSDDSKRNGINFVNTELDLSMTLAERALVSAEQL